VSGLLKPLRLLARIRTASASNVSELEAQLAGIILRPVTATIMKNSTQHGLLVIDKPTGITSRAVVNRIQRLFPAKTSIGHTGTLDPLATGVLVLCVGTATRLAEYVQRMKKTYVAELLLGVTSNTDDADGVITPSEPVSRPSREIIERCLARFVGEIDQTPPAFSAAKVQGQRSYRMARRGAGVAVSPRRVHVYAIDVLRYEYPYLELCVECGKGTYIRSLARDIGQDLQVGALVNALRRTRVGSFSTDNAIPVNDDLVDVNTRVLPMSAAVGELPQIRLDEDASARLCHGQTISFSRLGVVPPPEDDDLAVLNATGQLIAIARYDRAADVLVPVKVIR
jgi:tRNA pseudouridine55 synthase